jgi:hypothetical protein
LLGARPRPVVAFEVEAGREAAPAGEAQQGAALVVGDGPRFDREDFQRPDGGDVGAELRDGAAQPEQVLARERGPQDLGLVALRAGDDAPARARPCCRRFRLGGR